MRGHPLGAASGPPTETPGPGSVAGAGLAAGGLSGPALAGPVLSGDELAGDELGLAGGGLGELELDGPGLAAGGLDGPGLAAGGLDALVPAGLGRGELGPGLAAGLAQGVCLGLAALAPADVGPAGPGLAAGAGASAGGLSELGLDAPGLAAGGLAGVVVSARLPGLSVLVLAGLVLAGLLGLSVLVLAVPPGLAGPGLGGGTASADGSGWQLVAGCPGWPPCVPPAAPAAPVPEPLVPSSPVPAVWPPPPMEFRTAVACDSTCRPSGVSGETLIAIRTVTAATVTTRPSRSSGRWCPVAWWRWPAPPGRPGTRSTVCSQAETESRPPRAWLATQEHTTISQATGSGRGGVSRARIRSRPLYVGSTESTAACSAPRTKSS